jgi:predicted dithiol-disulfide oxidoreductase (DUF899 family)
MTDALRMTESLAFPAVVSEAEWRRARGALMAEEKAATRARDALADERRRQPMVRIEKPYVFESTKENVSLIDLFEGRRLIVYHVMFGPGAHGWSDAGCPGCGMFVDQVGHLAHLNARDVSFALMSIAPLAKIEANRRRMVWTMPRVSSAASGFNHDFGMTTDEGEKHGLSVLLLDAAGRGVEGAGQRLDLPRPPPFGRQEKWEDSPEDWPQTEPTPGGAGTLARIAEDGPIASRARS